MTKTTIDWPDLDYTWNPVIGCRRGCSYCYARKLHNFRHQAYLNGKLQNHPQYAKDYNEIQFLPKRLLEPAKEKKPSKIFVGSMCDMFGDGVPNRMIREIIKVCHVNDKHKFMFLTKDPHRYRNFQFPLNCRLGATVTSYKENCKITQLLGKKPVNLRTFLSIEPLLGSFSGVDLSGIDLVIVGAETGLTAKPPNPEWIYSIEHDNIYYKKNIREYLYFDECDVISPLHKKKFKTKVKIKSIKKFSPKPVIDSLQE